MGSTDKSFSLTVFEPKDYFLTETYVEFNQESVTEQRFSEDVDYDDAAIGQMLFDAYRGQVDHSERECRLFCRRRQCLKIERGKPVVNNDKSHDRIVQSVVEGHEIQRKNSENEQIRILLERQKEQILPDCQAEIRKHEFQADCDRRSIQKLNETIESQKEEICRAQAEERRRDQQLLHEHLF